MGVGQGQNGYLSEKNPVFSHAFPHQQYGEDMDNADLAGQREGDDGKIKFFKAFAGVTGGGKTQLAASGISMKTAKAGAWDALYRWGRLALPTPLPAELAGLKPGDPVYLSVTLPGGIQAAEPNGAGQLVQKVGEAFWEGERLTGINADEDANSVALWIESAVAV